MKYLLTLLLFLLAFGVLSGIYLHQAQVVYACRDDDCPDPPPPDPPPGHRDGYYYSLESLLQDCRNHGCSQSVLDTIAARGDSFAAGHGIRLLYGADGSITLDCENGVQVPLGFLPTSTPAVTNTPIPTATPTPIPACGAQCSSATYCKGATDGCTACLPGAGGNTCQHPPVCGADCTSNKSICEQATGGCTSCVPKGDGTSSCKAAPVCGADCTNNPTVCSLVPGCNACTPGTDGKSTCKAPACGTSCTDNPNICANATGGCNSCVPSAAGGNVCATAPACGTSCAGNPSICQQAGGGCGFCDATTNTCTAPPACGVSCATSAYCKQGGGTCSVCSQGKCAVDEYNPLACSCDGFTTTALFTGQKATFTAYAKVLGTDISKASVKDIIFKVFAGDKLIASSSAIPAVIDTADATKVRYKAAWDYTIPSNGTPGVTYSVLAEEHCQRAQPITLNTTNASHVVLGAQITPIPTKAPSFFSLLGRIFSNFFSLTSGTNTSATPTGVPPTNNPAKKDSLQMQTFYAGHVTGSSCTSLSTSTTNFTFGSN